jgi:hypothetical protein
VREFRSIYRSLCREDKNLRAFTPLQALTLGISAALLLAASGAAQADVITSLKFVSPSIIQVGGSVTVDFGITFIPIPATRGTPQFIDNQTASPVTTCAIDQNACTELQFNTTASIPTSIFAEVVAGNTPGPPNFYPFTSVGTFPLVLSYPNPGNWTVTTAGADQEQFSEVECNTQWNLGAPVGSASCSTIQTFSASGAFDPGGTPQFVVTANPPATAPEPSSLALLVAGLIAFCLWRRFIEFPT